MSDFDTECAAQQGAALAGVAWATSTLDALREVELRKWCVVQALVAFSHDKDIIILDMADAIRDWIVADNVESAA